MLVHKVRPMVGPRLLAQELAILKCAQLPSQSAHTQIIVKVQGDSTPLGHLELNLVVGKGHPPHLELCGRHTHHLSVYSNGRSRRIAVQHDPMRTATKTHAEQQQRSEKSHRPFIVARWVVG